MPTARENGIETLYHYQRFDPVRLADILVRQRVHCSNPALLNDPWDCRPFFDENSIDDPEVRRGFSSFIQMLVPALSLNSSMEKVLHKALEGDVEILRELIRKWSATFPDAIRERWEIYCLTPVPDSTLMWSHYADNHRGICLEFGTESSLFGAAWAVKYRCSYPTWNPHDLINVDGVDVLLSKSDDWEYEHEYRVIGIREPFCPNEPGLQIRIKDGYLDLPPGALRSVICGCEAPYDEINELVTGNSPSIHVKRAERQPNRYRLMIAG